MNPEQKQPVADLYCLAVFYGRESHIFNHIAARVPGKPCYLLRAGRGSPAH